MDGGEVEDSCVVMEVWSSSGSEEEEEERTTSSLVDEIVVEERAYRNSNVNDDNNKDSLCQEVSQGEWGAVWWGRGQTGNWVVICNVNH